MAYIIGICIKIGAWSKNKWMKEVKELMEEISELEQRHKA